MRKNVCSRIYVEGYKICERMNIKQQMLKDVKNIIYVKQKKGRNTPLLPAIGPSLPSRLRSADTASDKIG